MKPTEFRKMGPLAADHPAVGDDCYVCGLAVAAGDVVTLWPTQRDEDDDRLAWEGKVAHHACAVAVAAELERRARGVFDDPPPVVEARPFKGPRPPWKERMREWLKPEPPEQAGFEFED